MAQTSTGRRLTLAHRAAQMGIAAEGAAVARRLWRRLDPDDIRGSWSGWLDANLLAASTYYERSQRVAATYIDQYRAAEVGSASTGPVITPAFDMDMNRDVLSVAGPVAVLRGIREGYEPRHSLERSLNHYTGMMRRQIFAGGRMMIDETAGMDRRAVGWRRVAGAGACTFCVMLATRGAVGNGTLYRSKETALSSADDSLFGTGTRYHPHCVVPGTEVSGPDSNIGYRRYYEGEIVTLVTAAGNELTITPNHPVLTDRGWVEAGLLNEGDNLVSSVSRERNVVSGPDEDHVPSLIEDVVSALSMTRTSARLRVPGTAEQFHGDGFDSEINVVSANHLFGDDGQTLCGHPSLELDFHGASGELSALRAVESRLGAPVSALHGVGASSSGFLRGGGSGLSSFSAEGFVHENGSFASVPWLDATLFDPSSDDSAGNFVPFREAEGAFPAGVTTGEVGGNRKLVSRRLPVTRKFDAAPGNSVAETSRMFAERGGNLLNRLASSVHFDRLVNKSVGNYSGHVYNLSTREGWYSANSITVSNCACTAEIVYGEWTPNATEQKFIDIYREAAVQASAEDGVRTQQTVLPRMRQLMK